MVRKQVVHDHDIDIENDLVLRKMIETGTPLTLENYIDFAFLGNPPEGIEEDVEFVASVPDVILEGPRKVQKRSKRPSELHQERDESHAPTVATYCRKRWSA